MPDASVPEAIKAGFRPELASGDDWQQQTTPPIAQLIKECWAMVPASRPHFGRGGFRRRTLALAAIPDDEVLGEEDVTSEGEGAGGGAMDEEGITGRLERLELAMTKAADLGDSQLSMVTRLIGAQSTAQENEVVLRSSDRILYPHGPFPSPPVTIPLPSPPLPSLPSSSLPSPTSTLVLTAGIHLQD